MDVKVGQHPSIRSQLNLHSIAVRSGQHWPGHQRSIQRHCCCHHGESCPTSPRIHMTPLHDITAVASCHPRTARGHYGLSGKDGSNASREHSMCFILRLISGNTTSLRDQHYCGPRAYHCPTSSQIRRPATSWASPIEDVEGPVCNQHVGSSEQAREMSSIAKAQTTDTTKVPTPAEDAIVLQGEKIHNMYVPGPPDAAGRKLTGIQDAVAMRTECLTRICP